MPTLLFHEVSGDSRLEVIKLSASDLNYVDDLGLSSPGRCRRGGPLLRIRSST
jgi:hypothetical protein